VSTDLRAPFPWFGGKSRVAPLVWERFGNVANYVEPFFGSGAVLLGRPHAPKVETVNDLDCYLANFWRALQADPEGVARWADWPVNEADLLARHRWLIAQEEFRARIRTEANFHDAKIAGWWVWGLGQWIGSGWCTHSRVPDQLPHLGDAGRGEERKLPFLNRPGAGVHAKDRRGELHNYFSHLAARLRHVRVACGDWHRILGDSVTIKHGTTGVFLDPPYDEAEHTVTYASGTGTVAADVRRWALENGDNRLLRIALCGYAGEHDELVDADWSAVAWKARGGYGSQGEGRGRENAARERIWFSPHCLNGEQGDLLATLDAA
jgi:DNA adenine methylase